MISTMQKIGDTIYRFDINRRVYRDRTPGSFGGGAPIYSEHFEPLKIIGESKASWLLEHRQSVGKRVLAFNGYPRKFFTAEQMDDDIWANEHRYNIKERLTRVSVEQLRKVAAIIGYEAP